MTTKNHSACCFLRLRRCCCIALLAIAVVSARAQQPPVTVQVEIVQRPAGGNAAAGHSADASNVVVWLTPLDGATGLPVRAPAEQKLRLIQRNKQFEPHVL